MPAPHAKRAPTRKCGECRAGEDFPLPFTMAFQPIVDLRDGSIFAYEALVRGPANEPAGAVLAQVTKRNLYGFDQACRVRAIALATRLGLPATGASLSINFLPNAVYNPVACIQATLTAAGRVGFPLSSIIFEFTEGEEVVDHDHLADIIATYREMGFRTAIDDFGAGYSGLTLLARFQPDIVKLDMDLVRGIDGNPVKRSIVASVLTICRDLGITPLVEGVETAGEARALEDLGVSYMQGYLFARPGFEQLPEPAIPAPGPARAVA